MKNISLYLIVLIFAFGCTPTKKLKYTVDVPQSTDKYTNARTEKTIQPYDYLYIKIYSLDQTTNEIFNSDTRYGSQSEELISYSVNEKGYIDFPFVGDIYVKDMTIDQAKVMLEKELNKYLTNISIRVRFVANKITVIGEVRVPGSHAFLDEKINIFQALGLAGDIADYGDKTHVTLIREANDEINYHYLDLTKKDIVKSEYYYLLPNDVLIVDPVKAKYRSMRDYSVLYLLFATISAISTAYSLSK
jgi:polysaccharide biosynthesis/export protein